MRESNTQIQARPEANATTIAVLSAFSWILTLQSFLISSVREQKDHFVLWVPVFFACGIGAYFSLYTEPPLSMALILWAFFVCLFLLATSYRRDSTHHNFSVRFLLCVLLFVSGFTAGVIRTATIHTPVLSKVLGPALVEGNIVSLEPLEKGKGHRVVLDTLDIEDLSFEDTPERVRLTIRKDSELSVGQRIKVLAGLNPPSPPVIPGGFDFRRYLYFQSIGGIGFSYSSPEILHDAPYGFLLNFSDIRHNITTRISEILQTDQAAVAVALVVGKRGMLSDEDREGIRDAGLAHMLAISGLHIGLVAGTLFFVFRFFMSCFQRFALRYPIKKLAVTPAFLGAVFYMMMAGATIPTQRAVLTIAVVFLAILLDRSPISLRLVAFSAFVVLIFNPESLLSASFHMSFAAVTCLVYFYDVTRMFWSRLYSNSGMLLRVMFYFVSVCVTTLIASLATMPFALYHFGQVSFIGSLSNLLAVPVLAFIVMPFGLISVVLMPLGLERLPLIVMGAGIDVILDLARWGAGLPHAIIKFQAIPFIGFVCIICGFLFMILWKGALKPVGLLGVAVGLLFCASYKPADILVASSHKLFGFWNEEQSVLFVSSLQKERFVRGIWTEYYGLDRDNIRVLPYRGQDKNHSFATCGEQGCRFTHQGKNISYARQAYIHEKECQWADILISETPVKEKSCGARLVIDKFDSWRHGAYALRIEPDGRHNIERGADTYGQRPWSFPKKD